MKTRKVVALIIVVLLAEPGVVCWEADLHFGLTKWLAVKAGFSPSDAEGIAQGAESADEGSLYPAPTTVFAFTCLLHDVGASRFVEQNHFASYARVPEDPDKREVFPGRSDNGANSWTREEIASDLKDMPKERALHEFGASLHPLEDSWSHQGVPDIPPLCDRGLAWAHPASRDGWCSHNADLTYRHIPDAIETAKIVYQAMVEFGTRHHLLVNRPADWQALEPQVRDFAAADTKAGKRQWFQADPSVHFADFHFLDGIDLPDGKGWSRPARVAPAPLGAGAIRSAPDSPLAVVDTFLHAWIVRQEIGEAMELVDTQSLGKSLAQCALAKSAERLDALRFRKLLGTWLLEDHGLQSKEAYGLLPEATIHKDGLAPDWEGGARISARTLADAIETRGSTLPYLVVPIDKDHYVATFQFKHAPNDLIVLTVGKSDGRWRITDFWWLAL